MSRVQTELPFGMPMALALMLTTLHPQNRTDWFTFPFNDAREQPE